jgi:hypothetical protein
MQGIKEPCLIESGRGGAMAAPPTSLGSPRLLPSMLREVARILSPLPPALDSLLWL